MLIKTALVTLQTDSLIENQIPNWWRNCKWIQEIIYIRCRDQEMLAAFRYSFWNAWDTLIVITVEIIITIDVGNRGAFITKHLTNFHKK